MSARRLTTRGVAEVVRQRAKAVGLEYRTYAAHSLRAGSATEAFGQGAQQPPRDVLRAGQDRPLAQRTAPEHSDPGSWTQELAAAWVAGRSDARRRILARAGDRLHAPPFRRAAEARTKAQLIRTPRRFFYDLQEWEWIERRFDPRRAFELPSRSGR